MSRAWIIRLVGVLAFLGAGYLGLLQAERWATDYLDAQSRAHQPGVARAAIWGNSWGGGGGGGGVTSLAATGFLGVNAATGAVTVSPVTTGMHQGWVWAYDGTNWVPAQGSLQTPRYSFGCQDDFFGPVIGTTTGNCGSGVISAGAVTNLGVTDATHPGSQLWTLDGAADRVTYISNASTSPTIVIGASTNHQYDFVFQRDTLSNGTDTDTLRAGYIDTVNADAVDGIYFEVNSNAAANFQCKIAANSVRTTVDSGVILAINTWYWMHVEIDGTSAVRFYIGTAGGALTQVCAGISLANLPTGAARATQAGVSWIASAGTGVRNMSTDYFGFFGYFVSGTR